MMDSSSLDGECNEMSLDEKRQLVYELSKQSHLATEVLQAWTRQEILQILCAELGKERKYTGLTKLKIIETLLKIVSEKEDEGKKRDSSDCLPIQRNSKRQRKIDNPSRYVTPTSNNASGCCNSVDTKGESTIYCNNVACRAILRQEDSFCRRCSCCICRKYDDNKDPSLWLTCSSDPPFEGDSCGFSCHLECAFKTEKSGLAKDKQSEGCCCFYCVSCGKPNSLLECWKKQLMIAKETRRVDVLCYRLFLARKLLKGSKNYRNLCELVDEAVKSLEADVGPLTGLPMKIGRGIVNRLHSGPDVQRLCSSALETLETTPPDVAALPSPRSSKMQQGQRLSNEISADTTTTTRLTKIRLEDVNATSLTVILTASNEVPSPANIVHYSIWHRKVSEKDYPEKSTCTLFTPNTRFVVSGLAPASEYCFKVVSFSGTRELAVDEINVMTRSAQEGGGNCSSSPVERSESPLTNCSTLSSTPSSVEAESNNDYIVPKKPLKNDEKDSPLVEKTPAKRAKTKSDIAQIEKTAEQIVLLEEEEEAAMDKNGSGSETPVQVTTTNLASNRNHSDASLPITPFRSDQSKNRQASRNGKSAKENGCNGDHSANGGTESGLEHCVKIIRQLECSGHIEKDFRQKFLTWYSLRATPQEIRVVKIYIDTFTDDPMALAEQLVDTFGDRVSIKRSAGGGSGASAVVPSGLCMKLWH